MKPSLPAAFLILLSTWAMPAAAGVAQIAMGGIFHVPVVSLQERPFQTVVRQQFDYSCGSAALATLLRFHYGRTVSEFEIFQAMYEAGDKERIREVGFSLLDMKLYLESLDYQADGYRISIDKLAGVGVPAIALVEIDGYRHFVVIKGIRDDLVLVGDPAKGVRAYSREAFEQLRVDDIAFLVRNDAPLARANFNKTQDWDLRPIAAPLGQALERPVLADHGTLARIPAQFRVVAPGNVR